MHASTNLDAPANFAAEHRRHELLQAGLDMLDQGITVFDPELQLVAWNQQFLRLLDFPARLARVGAPFEDFIRYNAERGEYGAGDVEAQIAERVKAAANFQPHYTERTRPNGRIIAVRGEPLPDKGFITLYTDITAQRRYEEVIRRHNAELEDRVRDRTAELESANLRLAHAGSALRRSEERMRLITDTVPALIAYFDRDQIYRYANKGYAERFVRTKEEIVGHPVAEVVGHRVYAEVRPHLERAIAGEQVTYEYSIETDGGGTLFARSTLVPEVSPEGEVLGCFVLALDITEQKRTQAALMQAQKMEAVGQLTGGLAHDFNNMLTVVIGNLAALRDRRPDDPEIVEFLDPALGAARRGVELIKRLLAFSRQQPLEPRPVEVGGLALGMMKLLRRSLPETIAISAHAHDQALQAMTDPHQLESALLNLALNARDAMPGGGRLTIESAAVTVGEDSAGELDAPAGAYVAIDVTDTGTGMDAATLARAFEPFFTTKRFGSGSGLGLSMVYGFAKQSGGSARILSEPGRGTTVRLLLPRATEQAIEPVEAPASAVESSAQKPLVLLVEDDPEVRKIVRLQLTDLGYPVLEADNGTEAAAMLDQVPDIRIILSDIVMPGGMDGRALARHARVTKPAVKVVLMSGYADRTQDDGTSERDTAMLGKPFATRELAAVLETA